MKPVVIDTNILFASLRSKSSKIREIFDNPEYRFYTPNFLVVEIFRHKERILQKSKANDEEVYEFLNKILHKINFVSEEHISIENLIYAHRLCDGIDEKDTPFVALTIELNGVLWSRDNVLKSGLIKKGFNTFFEES